MKRSDILDAWVFLRKKNNDIPDGVVDFIKDVALAAYDGTNAELNQDIVGQLAAVIVERDRFSAYMMRACEMLGEAKEELATANWRGDFRDDIANFLAEMPETSLQSIITKAKEEEREACAVALEGDAKTPLSRKAAAGIVRNPPIEGEGNE